MTWRVRILLIALVVLVLDLAAALGGYLTDRIAGVELFIFGSALAIFSRPLAMAARQAGESNALIAHWSRSRPLAFIIAGTAVAILGLAQALGVLK